MDLTIFKIAGWMALILLGGVLLLALIYSWDDIEISISSFFSERARERELRRKREEEEFKKQVLTILEYKGRYDPSKKLRIYNDSKVTIRSNDSITWKSKSGDPMEDCVEYINELYASCTNEIEKRFQASEKIYTKALRVITYLGRDEEYQSGDLSFHRDDRSSNIVIYLNGQLVFSKTDFRNVSSLSAYRPGKWEKDLDVLYEDATKRKEEIAIRKAAKEEEKKIRYDEEAIRNFSPI